MLSQKVLNSIQYYLDIYNLSESHIGRVLDVEEGKESYIVGTIFCENIDRSNVFEEIENDQVRILPSNASAKYIL